MKIIEFLGYDLVKVFVVVVAAWVVLYFTGYLVEKFIRFFVPKEK
jgi:hypothetical protein